jgi:hypothetical protein
MLADAFVVDEVVVIVVTVVDVVVTVVGVVDVVDATSSEEDELDLFSSTQMVAFCLAYGGCVTSEIFVSIVAILLEEGLTDVFIVWLMFVTLSVPLMSIIGCGCVGSEVPTVGPPLIVVVASTGSDPERF